jgi:DNA polymerase
MEYFLPGAAIGNIHGQPHRVAVGNDTFLVIPLYHPAAALYNGSLRATLIEDFLGVPAMIANQEASSQG